MTRNERDNLLGLCLSCLLDSIFFSRFSVCAGGTEANFDDFRSLFVHIYKFKLVRLMMTKRGWCNEDFMVRADSKLSEQEVKSYDSICVTCVFLLMIKVEPNPTGNRRLHQHQHKIRPFNENIMNKIRICEFLSNLSENVFFNNMKKYGNENDFFMFSSLFSWNFSTLVLPSSFFFCFIKIMIPFFQQDPSFQLMMMVKKKNKNVIVDFRILNKKMWLNSKDENSKQNFLRFLLFN